MKRRNADLESRLDTDLCLCLAVRQYRGRSTEQGIEVAGAKLDAAIPRTFLTPGV